MDIEKKQLGQAIQNVRTARGMTQQDLARAADVSGVALIEQGRRFVSMEMLNKLANALSIPPACLAILGSQSVGDDKHANDFMKSLQELISTIVAAQAEEDEVSSTTASGANAREREQVTRLVGAAKRLRRTGLGGASKQGRSKLGRGYAAATTTRPTKKKKLGVKTGRAKTKAIVR